MIDLAFGACMVVAFIIACVAVAMNRRGYKG